MRRLAVRAAGAPFVAVDVDPAPIFVRDGHIAAAQPDAPGPAIVFRRGTAPFEVSGEVTDLFARTPRFDQPL